MVESDEKKCPHCAEVIKKEARVCKHCGRDLAPKRYRPPIWSDRPSPYWEKEVKEKTKEEIHRFVFWYEIVPFIVVVSILAMYYVPQTIIETRKNKEEKRFYFFENRIEQGDDLSEAELEEYLERVTARYGPWNDYKKNRVNAAVNDIAKRIDEDTHTIWINPAEWSNWPLAQRSLIQDVSLYFFIKNPRIIPYGIIRSIEDDSVIATMRGTINEEIIRK